MALGNIAISITIDEKFKKDLKKIEKEVQTFAKRVQTSLGKAGAGFQQLGGTIGDVGKKMTAFVSIPIIAGLGLATKAAITFEDQMADVGKTTGATKEELKDIGEGLLDLSTNTRTSVADLTLIATEAGRLGIAAEDVVQFTATIDKLHVALGDDLGGDAQFVTGEITKLVNVFGLVSEDADILAENLSKVGSTINSLAANSSAGADDILDFTRRVGPVASLVNITVQEVSALGATFSSLGQRTEVSGTAVQKILFKMGENTKEFASIAGKSVGEFEQLLKEDALEALLLVSEGVKDAGTDVKSLTKTFDDMGIDGIRAVGVLGALAKNTDSVRENVLLANKAYEENISLLEEYERKNKTTAAELGKLKNTMFRLGVEVGSALLPVLNKVVGVLKDIIIAATDLFGELPSGVKTAILAFAGFLAVLGPVLIVVGTLISAIGAILPVLGALAAFVGTVGLPIILLAAALTTLSIAFGALFTFLAKRFGLLDVIVDRFILLYNQVKNTIANIRKAFEDPRVQASLDKLKDAFRGLLDAVKPIFESIIDLIQSVFGPLDSALGDDLDESAFLSVEQAVNLLAGAFEFLAEKIEQAKPFIEFVADQIANMIDMVAAGVEGLQNFGNTLKEAWESKEVQDGVEKLKDAFSDAKEAIDKLKESLGKLFSVFSKGEGDQKGAVDGAEGLNKELEDTETTLDKVISAIEFLISTFERLVEGITVVIETFARIVIGLEVLITFFKELPGNVEKFLEETGLKVSEFVNKVVNLFTVILPQRINEGVQRVKTFWDQLPQKANEVGIKIGEFIRGVVENFLSLPGRIAVALTEFKESIAQKFTETRDEGTSRMNELVNGIITFFQQLPGKLSVLLTETLNAIVLWIENTKLYLQEQIPIVIENIVNFFATLPAKIGEKLTEALDAFVLWGTTLASKAFDIGTDMVNGIINGIKSIGSKIGDTVGGFFSGIGSGLGLAKGGVVPKVQNFANGGFVKSMGKTLYAAKGAFTPKGSDTVPAMLTPGELVIPKGLVGNIMGILKKVSSLPGVGKAYPGVSGSKLASVLSNMGGGSNGVNVNINTLNARSEEEAKRRAGDLGFGLKLKMSGDF